MSCCPGIRCKNTGSGYVKNSGGSESAKELDARMNELLEARRAMDERIWSRSEIKARPEKVSTTQNLKRIKELTQ